MIRNKNKWTQQQAANLYGISSKSYGAYEEGRALPQFITVIRIADVVGIKDVRDLISKDLKRINIVSDIDANYQLLPPYIKKAVNILLKI